MTTPKTSSSGIVEFKDLHLYFPGIPLLKGITLTIPEGSFHFLTGPSGSGKSTFLNLLHMTLFPSQGSLCLQGLETQNLSQKDQKKLRQTIGFVFQDFRLLDHLTAQENVALPLIVRGGNRQTALEQAAELLDWVGLGKHLSVNPPLLSGGQKQRVGIARAVITQPRLLLADEPTGNVDQEVGRQLVYLLEQINKQGVTVIMATHNESIVREFGFPELRLQGGRITLKNRTS